MPPFFFRNKLSSHHERIPIGVNKGETKIDKSENNKDMKGYKVSKSSGVAAKFILMNELRNKISTFRDLLDFPPCNGSSSVSELIKCTLKDLYKTYPQIRQTLLVSEGEATPVLQVYDFFCIAIESLGDFWANGDEWKDKCKNKTCQKLDLDELEELVLAKLEDINKLASERLFDMIDEDEQLRGGCSPPSNTAFGKALSRSYSDDNKSFTPSSPDISISVLPLVPHISSDGIKVNVSSPRLFPLRVQAIMKLNQIDVKRLSFHMFPHVAAQDPNFTIKDIDPTKEVRRVETIYDFVVEQPVNFEDSNDQCSDKMLIDTPRVQAKETSVFDVKKADMEVISPPLNVKRLHPDVTEKDGPAPVPPSPAALFPILNGEDSQMSPRQPVSLHVSPVNFEGSNGQCSDEMLIDTPGVQAKETSDFDVKKDNMEMISPPPTPKSLHPNVVDKDEPAPTPNGEDSQMSPRHPVSPHVSPENKLIATRLKPPSQPASPSVSPEASLTSTHVSILIAPPSPQPLKTQSSLVSSSPPTPHLPSISSKNTSFSPPPPLGKGGAAPRPPPIRKGSPGAPPPPPIGKGGPGAPPPPPPGHTGVMKAKTKLKRSSQMGNLYRLLKRKVEGSCLTGKTQGRGKIGAPAGGKAQGMADALAEITNKSAYFVQIEEDVKHHAPVIRQMKVAINSFQTLDMAELIKFHKYVESHLEKLTDESQVLARFEDFPTKKLEALRMSAALHSKLEKIVQTLQNWQIVSPVNQVLDKFESYFTKIKLELDALERTKDEEAKRFQAHKITFDFSVLIRIKELIVDVSSSCMELALKEKREVKTKEVEGNINPKKLFSGGKKNESGKIMWRTFQFAYSVYSFAGGHDDRADMLTRELAQEIETDPHP